MMKRITYLICICMLLVACNQDESDDKGLSLDGAWTLTQVVDVMGNVQTYPVNGRTYGRIYEGDSVCRSFQLMATASGMVIVAGATNSVTLFRREANDYLYLEDGEPRPLKIVNDTTITLQHYGVVYTWVRACDMTPQRIQEIRDIIIADSDNDANEQVQHFVLSTTERELRHDNSLLTIYLSAAVVLIILIAWMLVENGRRIRREKMRIRQAEERIRQLSGEREQRAKLITDAFHQVENELFASDYYHSLRRTLSDGRCLKESDWLEAERRLVQVYPGFTTELRRLYRMSEIEYQVCLLIKLRFTPNEIAQLLARDASSISTIRSRLFEKVFGRKGGARDWDSVVMGIGT